MTLEELKAQRNILKEVQTSFKNQYGMGHFILVKYLIDKDIEIAEYKTKAENEDVVYVEIDGYNYPQINNILPKKNEKYKDR